MAASAKTILAQFPKSNASGSSLSQADEMRKSINALVDDAEFARRILNVNTTGVGNVGVGEDDLMVYILPANTMNVTGDAVRVRGWGKLANNANAKQLVMYFHGAAVLNLAMTASIAGRWYVDALVLRTGLSAQDFVALINESIVTLAASKQAQVDGTATQTETAALTIKFTGTATTDNDIIQEGMIVEFLPAASHLTGYKINYKY